MLKTKASSGEMCNWILIVGNMTLSRKVFVYCVCELDWLENFKQKEKRQFEISQSENRKEKKYLRTAWLPVLGKPNTIVLIGSASAWFKWRAPSKAVEAPRLCPVTTMLACGYCCFTSFTLSKTCGAVSNQASWKPLPIFTPGPSQLKSSKGLIRLKSRSFATLAAEELFVPVNIGKKWCKREISETISFQSGSRIEIKLTFVADYDAHTWTISNIDVLNTIAISRQPQNLAICTDLGSNF